MLQQDDSKSVLRSRFVSNWSAVDEIKLKLSRRENYVALLALSNAMSATGYMVGLRQRWNIDAHADGSPDSQTKRLN
jgi:hypothetical protein